ncbi:hypothetical protein AWH49_03735 [Domibacillus aminovorans]|uniref:Uncharacterized protein n=1 Tax=Domibacillus aminovorans TaxID=29332 RepID=A0A177L0L7_9BACI|nr:hypothetical protein AWH49_03735 [Domibacillus aminovorans]
MQTKPFITSVSKKAANIKHSEYLNLPNVRFYNWCREQYGLNKGVFHTIDDWFYEYGIVNILSRRVYLLAFLEYAKASGMKQEDHKFIRFGNGGLVVKLREFLQIQEDEVYMI